MKISEQILERAVARARLQVNISSLRFFLAIVYFRYACASSPSSFTMTTISDLQRPSQISIADELCDVYKGRM